MRTSAESRPPAVVADDRHVETLATSGERSLGDAESDAAGEREPRSGDADGHRLRGVRVRDELGELQRHRRRLGGRLVRGAGCNETNEIGRVVRRVFASERRRRRPARHSQLVKQLETERSDSL